MQAAPPSLGHQSNRSNFAIMVGALLLRSGLRFASRRSSAQQKRGITVTRCVQGVEKKITQEGNGPSPQRGQKVSGYIISFMLDADSSKLSDV